MTMMMLTVKEGEGRVKDERGHPSLRSLNDLGRLDRFGEGVKDE